MKRFGKKVEKQWEKMHIAAATAELAALERVGKFETFCFEKESEIEGEYEAMINSSELEEYSEALQTLVDFLQDTAGLARDYADARSESWMESDTGQQHDEWINELDAAADGITERIDHEYEMPQMEIDLDFESVAECDDIPRSPDAV